MEVEDEPNDGTSGTDAATRAAVEAYLHEHIPLSAEMRVTVVSVGDDGVVLEAPLEPNLNHRSTAFGGSVSALAILAGWTNVHARLRREGRSGHVVIQESRVRYDAPIHGTFRAISPAIEDVPWDRLLRVLDRRGKGRVHVTAAIEDDEGVAATFRGAFVALLDEV